MAFNLGSLVGMGSGALNIIFLVLIILIPISIVIILFFYFRNQKKYKQFTCVIFGKDGFGQPAMSFDNAGIFVDNKTNSKRLFLKRNKTGLSPDNIPYIQCGIKKYILLLQTGLKNFSYITPNLDASGITLAVGEEDVNWGLNSYERAKKIFSPSDWKIYLPYIGLATMGIFMVIMLYIFLGKVTVLKEVATALKETASILASRGTTTVLPGAGG
jgi:hypothetical protein